MLSAFFQILFSGESGQGLNDGHEVSKTLVNQTVLGLRALSWMQYDTEIC